MKSKFLFRRRRRLSNRLFALEHPFKLQQNFLTECLTDRFFKFMSNTSKNVYGDDEAKADYLPK